MDVEHVYQGHKGVLQFRLCAFLTAKCLHTPFHLLPVGFVKKSSLPHSTGINVFSFHWRPHASALPHLWAKSKQQNALPDILHKAASPG